LGSINEHESRPGGRLRTRGSAPPGAAMARIGACLRGAGVRYWESASRFRGPVVWTGWGIREWGVGSFHIGGRRYDVDAVLRGWGLIGDGI
jgi:hypothetical protein